MSITYLLMAAATMKAHFYDVAIVDEEGTSL